MDARGYIIIPGEGINDGYFYIRLLPDINDLGSYIQLDAIYTDESEAEVDADRIMAFVAREGVDE
jgi:hypothetical protein